MAMAMVNLDKGFPKAVGYLIIEYGQVGCHNIIPLYKIQFTKIASLTSERFTLCQYKT